MPAESHSEDAANPTRKAALSAYHKSLLAGPPVLGVFCKEAGMSPAALNNTLFSATCKCARGRLVPIPTYCPLSMICELPKKVVPRNFGI